MIVTPIHTPLVRINDDIKQIISSSINSIPEKSVLVVSSKIVSTCENRLIKKITHEKSEKQNLAKNEADWYMDPHTSKYNIMLTIKRNIIFANAGIDESNADNSYLLWPKDPQKSANEIWKFLRNHYGLAEVGVTISDSSSYMLNWGVVGRAIVHCGFNPLRNYIGKKDLFGYTMLMEQTNVMQSITDAAVVEMGECAEQTPLAIVSDMRIPIEFLDHVPTESELYKLKISIDDDMYAPILKSAPWKRGNSGKKSTFISSQKTRSRSN